MLFVAVAVAGTAMRKGVLRQAGRSVPPLKNGEQSNTLLQGSAFAAGAGAAGKS